MITSTTFNVIPHCDPNMNSIFDQIKGEWEARQGHIGQNPASAVLQLRLLLEGGKEEECGDRR